MRGVGGHRVGGRGVGGGFLTADFVAAFLLNRDFALPETDHPPEFQAIIAPAEVGIDGDDAVLIFALDGGGIVGIVCIIKARVIPRQRQPGQGSAR